MQDIPAIRLTNNTILTCKCDKPDMKNFHWERTFNLLGQGGGGALTLEGSTGMCPP